MEIMAETQYLKEKIAVIFFSRIEKKTWIFQLKMHLEYWDLKNKDKYTSQLVAKPQDMKNEKKN